ncbi:MAG: DUF721 domain-containing protein [Proteobacteria bacterium]|nr:DUF721 domain-containing protein [Burkholderiales bacterium]
MTTKSVGDVLQSEDRLRVLRGEALRLSRLQTRMDELLPVSVSGSCSVAALRDGVLTLVTSSPAVATSVSQIALRLAVQIREIEAEVTTIKVMVQPSEARAPVRFVAPAVTPISAESQRVLQELSANVSDRRLKAALQSLSRPKRPSM